MTIVFPFFQASRMHILQGAPQRREYGGELRRDDYGLGVREDGVNSIQMDLESVGEGAKELIQVLGHEVHEGRVGLERHVVAWRRTGENDTVVVRAERSVDVGVRRRVAYLFLG